MTTTHPTGREVCGAGVWLLATTGPSPLDEHRAYRTHCQATPNHSGAHTVRVAGEPDDATATVEPVTLTWPRPNVAAEDVDPAAGDPEPGRCRRCGGDPEGCVCWHLAPPQLELRGVDDLIAPPEWTP